MRWSFPTLSRHGAVAAIAAIAACTLGTPTLADSQINLSLVGPTGNVTTNQTIDVKLRATRQPISSLFGEGFVAIDMVLGWNPNDLQLLGVVQSGSVQLMSSQFPSPTSDYTGINEASPPADGDGLYSAFAPLGSPVVVPLSGVQVTTFRFKVKRHFELTQVQILPTLTRLATMDTAVYDNVIPGLNVVGTLTSTVVTTPCALDADGDGACASNDCNDSDSAIRPGSAELCSTVGIDNDCDGNFNEIDTLAADKVLFYTDADDDGATLTTSAIFCPGTLNSGYQPTASEVVDCDDTDSMSFPGAPELCATIGVDNNCNGSATDSDSNAPDRTTFYRDIDGDGAGDASFPALACAAPAGYVANASDGCPTDGTKSSPGACGCGIADADINSNSIADCLEIVPVLAFASDAAVYAPGDAFVVRMSLSPTGVRTTGVRAAIRFDTEHLAFVSAVPVVGGPFAIETAETFDAANGIVRNEVVRAANAPATLVGGAVIDYIFVVVPGSSVCTAPGLVQLASDPTWPALVATEVGTSLTPTGSPLPPVRLDGSNPILSGVPAPIALAADAGTNAGAFVPAPTVSAQDDCDGTLTTSTSIAFPSGSVGNSWPASGYFPVGTSLVTFSATDAAGNMTAESMTIAVANNQLLDADLTFIGVFNTASTRPIRFTVGGVSTVKQVAFAGTAGTALAVEVPVAAAHVCMAAKDTVHSVADTAIPSVVGLRWSASFELYQGDSNDDNAIDVLDFGIFIGDIGLTTVAARSDFNSNSVVQNADFSFISLNFLRAGETCGAFDGVVPRARVAVRTLRRTGLGEAAVGDLNGDGWLDELDIAHYQQFGLVPARRPMAPIEAAPQRVNW